MARTVAQVQADIDAVHAARGQIIAGQRVKEVWREGRRLTFESMSLADCQRLLDALSAEMDEAIAGESGRSRRRAIGIGWAN